MYVIPFCVFATLMLKCDDFVFYTHASMEVCLVVFSNVSGDRKPFLTCSTKDGECNSVWTFVGVYSQYRQNSSPEFYPVVFQYGALAAKEVVFVSFKEATFALIH